MAVDHGQGGHVIGRGKISEAFLEFAEPVLPEDFARVEQDEVNNALMVASLIWNAVVLEQVRGDRSYLNQLHEQTAVSPHLRSTAQLLLKRKYDHYKDDHRLVRRCGFRFKNGQPHVWAEAGDPYSLRSPDTP